MKNIAMRISMIALAAAMFAVCAFAGILRPSDIGDAIVTDPSFGNQEQENGAENGTPEDDGAPGDSPADGPAPPADTPAQDGADEPAPPADGPADPPAAEQPPADAPEEAPPEKEYVRAKVNGLQVRSGPGTGYSSLGYIDKNDMVTLLGKSGNWYKTLYKNKTAYVSADAAHSEVFGITLQDEDEAVENVIAVGLQLLGYPYVYGATRLHDGSGNLIKGFDKTKYDCSSLMQYMYYHGASVNLYMTTRTQVKQGKFVAKKNLRRGDLMFFTNAQRYNKTGVERIGHVALYLGDNYILHTASDYAVIEPISTQRWNYYIESRRVL